MARVDDVAAAILDKAGGQIDTWKLQKLLYFAQAVHLAWYDEPLFDEPVEAWKDGPVVPRVYRMFGGARDVYEVPEGDAHRVSERDRGAISFVWGEFGHRRGEDLRELTHQEGPWGAIRQAAGRSEDQWGNDILPHEMLRDYARSIPDLMDQAWYWTPEWQAGEREARADLEEGRTTFYASDAEFLASF